MPYKHIKTDQQHLEQIADDAQTTEHQTTKEIINYKHWNRI